MAQASTLSEQSTGRSLQNPSHFITWSISLSFRPSVRPSWRQVPFGIHDHTCRVWTL